MCKTNYPELEKMVNELDKHSRDEKCVQVECLQKICDKFLNEYVVKVDDYTIKPLWVEAYYRNDSNFTDQNTHGVDKQKNRFGKLYFHEKGRGGVDICLSCGSYYFSLLIKISLVSNEGGKSPCIKKQTKLYNLLKPYKDLDESVLEKRKTEKEEVVFHTVRKGLIKNDGYRNELLASVIDIHRKENGKTIFSWERGYGKEWTVAEYMHRHPENDRGAQCKALLGYHSNKVLNILKEMEVGK